MTIKVLVLRELFPKVLADMEEKIDKSLSEMGILTGIPKLDQLIGGFKPLGLYIIAARTNVGKSALMIQFALEAIKQGKKVLFLSLEMTNEEVIERIVVNEGRIDSSYLNTGGDKLMQEQKNNIRIGLAKARSALEPYLDNLIMVDKKLSIDEVTLCSTEQKADIIFVDYLQYVDPVGSHFSRHREVAQVSAGLKSIAKDLGVPVVAAVQVNRAPASSKKSEQRRPGLADLRESGDIEQDADVALILHRERDEDGHFVESGEATITVAKGRRVKQGTVNTIYIGEQFRFEPVATPSPSDPLIQPNGPDGSLSK